MLANEPSLEIAPVEKILIAPPLATYLPSVDRPRDERHESALTECLTIMTELASRLDPDKQKQLLALQPEIERRLEGKTLSSKNGYFPPSFEIFRTLSSCESLMATDPTLADHIFQNLWKEEPTNAELSGCEVDYVYIATILLDSFPGKYPSYTKEDLVETYKDRSTRMDAYTRASQMIDWFARSLPMPIQLPFKTKEEFRARQWKLARELGDTDLYETHRFSGLGMQKLTEGAGLTSDNSDRLPFAIIGCEEINTEEFRLHEVEGHGGHIGLSFLRKGSMLDEMLTEVFTWEDPSVGLLEGSTINYDKLQNKSLDYINCVKLWLLLAKDPTLTSLLRKIYSKGGAEDTYELSAHIINTYGFGYSSALFLTTTEPSHKRQPHDYLIKETRALFEEKLKTM